MDDERALTFALETLRTENRSEHHEILSKLGILCTKVAVTESKVEILGKFKDDHEEEHSNDDRTALAYFIGFIMLGLGLAADFILRR